MDSVQASSTELAQLTMRWVGGWTAARGYPCTRADPDTVTVSIGEPGRDEEHIALTDTADHHAALVRCLESRDGRRLVMPTHERAKTVRLAEDAGYAVGPPEWLMTTLLSDHPRMAAPPGYEVVLSARGAATVVEVAAADGIAAKGQIGVVGTDAVADRIFTMPAHRRRGLGRVVMGALADAAAERGAWTGLLVASADGHGLYEALGWHPVVEIVTAGNPGDLRRHEAAAPSAATEVQAVGRDPLE